MRTIYTTREVEIPAGGMSTSLELYLSYLGGVMVLGIFRFCGFGPASASQMPFPGSALGLDSVSHALALGVPAFAILETLYLTLIPFSPTH